MQRLFQHIHNKTPKFNQIYVLLNLRSSWKDFRQQKKTTPTTTSGLDSPTFCPSCPPTSTDLVGFDHLSREANSHGCLWIWDILGTHPPPKKKKKKHLMFLECFYFNTHFQEMKKSHGKNMKKRQPSNPHNWGAKQVDDEFISGTGLEGWTVWVSGWISRTKKRCFFETFLKGTVQVLYLQRYFHIISVFQAACMYVI